MAAAACSTACAEAARPDNGENGVALMTGVSRRAVNTAVTVPRCDVPVRSVRTTTTGLPARGSLPWKKAVTGMHPVPMNLSVAVALRSLSHTSSRSAASSDACPRNGNAKVAWWSPSVHAGDLPALTAASVRAVASTWLSGSTSSAHTYGLAFLSNPPVRRFAPLRTTTVSTPAMRLRANLPRNAD